MGDPQAILGGSGGVDEGRPNPDALLKLLQARERGSLKIYVGLAAGVGKTYRMLSEAREQKARGTDVVVGVIETHGRLETAERTQGFETVPPRSVQHAGIDLREFDLEAALARKPQLILVDELAHTNAPGSKYPKRWQDVEELLIRGINVWTTLNVQHLESLNDLVERVTGIRVQETVPDAMLEMAAEVVNVDLPVDELLKRLQEGKIYPPERIRTALANFFQPGKLTALRELALREVARDVGAKAAAREGATGTPAGPQERVLVAINPDHPNVSELIRKGARLAGRFNTDWEVVLVDTPRSNESNRQLSKTQQLEDDFDLARSLGAEVVRLKGDDTVATLLDYAQKNRIGQIVVARARASNLSRAFRKDFVDRLVEEAGPTDVYLVSLEGKKPE